MRLTTDPVWETATRKLIEQTESGRIKWQGAGAVPEDSTFFKCKIKFYHVHLRLAGNDQWVIEFATGRGEIRWRWPDYGITHVLRQAILNAKAPPEFTKKFLQNFLR